jgi:hypothetical protein
MLIPCKLKEYKLPSKYCIRCSQQCAGIPLVMYIIQNSTKNVYNAKLPKSKLSHVTPRIKLNDTRTAPLSLSLVSANICADLNKKECLILLGPSIKE